MILSVRRHQHVERDILDLAAWIARDSRETAYRFLDAVEGTIKGRRAMLGKGSLKQLRGAQFARVRTWAIRGFPNHLIVYEKRPNEVYVYAVVHGSRRYRQLLQQRIR